MQLTPRRAALCLALASACTAAVGGCGAGSPRAAAPAATGRFSTLIHWPAQRSRAIPAATQCVEVRLSNAAGWRASTAVVRPAQETTSQLTVANVPAGSVHVHFGAYDSQGPGPTVKAAGNLLAYAAADVQVNATGDTTVPVTFSSTPARVVVSAPGGQGSVPVGAALPLSAAAYDVDGDVLLVPGFTWQSSDPGVASVDVAGVVTGVTGGSASMTATETGSGVQGSLAVAVQAGSITGTIQ